MSVNIFKIVIVRVRLLLSLICLAAAVSCGKFGLYTPHTEKPIAKVGENELYMRDLENIFNTEMTAEDSAKLIDSYINNWVRSQVKKEAAQKALSSQRAHIEELVEQYRTSLTTYMFENDYVASHLDTTLTTEQIQTYYNKNRDNFLLAGPIVKAAVVRIPAKNSSRRIEDMFKKNTEKDWDEFVAVAQKNGYKLDDYSREWVDFSTVIGHIPFYNSNFDEFLKSKKNYEVADEQYKYLMKILSFRLAGDYMPAERATDNIRKILLAARRSELVRTMEDSLVKVETDNDRVTINNNQ